MFVPVPVPPAITPAPAPPRPVVVPGPTLPPAADPGDGLKPRPLPTPDAPPTTDGGTHVVGGEQVGGIGQAPQPTLQGIAVALGQIEGKAAWLMRNSGGGAVPLPPDWIDKIVDAIKKLLEGIDGGKPSGLPDLGPVHYIAIAQADFNSDGSRRQFEFNVPRQKGPEFLAQYLRVQAEYLFWLKGLRSFVAKRPTVDTSPVTITWIEVPEV